MLYLIRFHVEYFAFSSLLAHAYTIATPSSVVTSITHPQFALNCSTSGSPATVTWTFANGSVAYQNGMQYTITHILRNGATASYDNLVTFTRHPDPSDLMTYSCVASATYVSSNVSVTTSTTTTGKHVCKCSTALKKLECYCL